MTDDNQPDLLETRLMKIFSELIPTIADRKSLTKKALRALKPELEELQQWRKIPEIFEDIPDNNLRIECIQNIVVANRGPRNDSNL